MHVLVSPPPSVVDGRLAGVGHVGDEFCWTVPGEVLVPGSPCDSPDCGCDRAFTGLQSRKGTTVGVVADLDMTEREVQDLVRDSTIRAGWDDEQALAWWWAITQECLDCARDNPVGTLVRVSHSSDGLHLHV